MVIIGPNLMCYLILFVLWLEDGFFFFSFPMFIPAQASIRKCYIQSDLLTPDTSLSSENWKSEIKVSVWPTSNTFIWVMEETAQGKKEERTSQVPSQEHSFRVISAAITTYCRLGTIKNRGIKKSQVGRLGSAKSVISRFGIWWGADPCRWFFIQALTWWEEWIGFAQALLLKH